MDKQSLLEKIKASEHLTADERAYLTNLINTKKYGLVWEDKPEDAEELLRTHLPVLTEVVERRITPPQQTPPQPSPKRRESALNENTANLEGLKSETYATQTSLFEVAAEENNGQITNSQNEQQLEHPVIPPLGGGLGRGVNHILIEGDNLHALTALTFTHEGKVDVIYIDPPYNTGNKDFKYNDSFVDKEDGYRHSKWLSFMHKRLEIAKRLLSDKGVIFISIDDNEQAQLKLLCDEVFGEINFISCIAVVNNFSGRSDDKYIATAHENLLIYKKPLFNSLGITPPEEYIGEYKLEDKNGKYRLQGLRKRGSGAKRADRPNMYYPFYFQPVSNHLTLDKPQELGYLEIYPKLSDNTDGRWRWGIETAKTRLDELQVNYVKKRKEFDISQKDYLNKEGSIKKIKPKSIWLSSEFSSDFATTQFKEILKTNTFNFPKSTELIKYCLEQSANTLSIILDFFAGSGTTLHATMQLNAEDGGNRQCILVTNNENNICEEVTYERNKRVIQGYTNAKGVHVAGLTNNNLRYYRTEFVGRERSLKNKRALVQAATQMLCVKEDIYLELNEVAGQKIDNKNYRCFSDAGRYMLVIYNEEAIEELVPVIANIESQQKIKIYIFAPGQYPFTEEFEDVLDKVELCALPDAIYKAYSNVLPKKKVE